MKIFLLFAGVLAYETLNLVDGKRTVSDIRDWLISEFAPEGYPITVVDIAAYPSALERIGVTRYSSP